MSAENLAPTGIRSPDRPARSKSLHLEPLTLLQVEVISNMAEDKDSKTPLNRMLVTRIANYPDKLSGKFVENSRNYRLSDQVQYSVVASRTSNQAWWKSLDAGTYCKYNSRTSNCQCSLFSKKNPIIRIFCISGWLGVPINPDKRSSTVGYLTKILTPQLIFKTVSI
jgi:hypothetical protein